MPTLIASGWFIESSTEMCVGMSNEMLPILLMTSSRWRSGRAPQGRRDWHPLACDESPVDHAWAVRIAVGAQGPPHSRRRTTHRMVPSSFETVTVTDVMSMPDQSEWSGGGVPSRIASVHLPRPSTGAVLPVAAADASDLALTFCRLRSTGSREEVDL
jgi:hypothetical protein